jgi:hypothetical protein
LHLVRGAIRMAVDASEAIQKAVYGAAVAMGPPPIGTLAAINETADESPVFSEKGTWVRIFRPPVEGRVVREFHGLDVGDRVSVALIGTNAEKGFIDFASAS